VLSVFQHHRGTACLRWIRVAVGRRLVFLLSPATRVWDNELLKGRLSSDPTRLLTGLLEEEEAECTGPSTGAEVDSVEARVPLTGIVLLVSEDGLLNNSSRGLRIPVKSIRDSGSIRSSIPAQIDQ